MARRPVARPRAGGAIRRALFAVCLAAAAIAGDERPAGANQLCKADKCSPGQRWDTSRPIKVRLPPDSEAYEVFVRVVPHDRADLWSRDLDKRNNAIMLAAA